MCFYIYDRRRDGVKRELGIARCGLACCLCAENDKCAGCSSGNALIRPGVRTEGAQLIKKLVIALIATWIVKKDC